MSDKWFITNTENPPTTNVEFSFSPCSCRRELFGEKSRNSDDEISMIGWRKILNIDLKHICLLER